MTLLAIPHGVTVTADHILYVQCLTPDPLAVRDGGGQGGVDVGAAQLEGRRTDAGLRRDGDDVGQGGQRGLRGTPEGAGRLHQEPAEQRQVL